MIDVLGLSGMDRVTNEIAVSMNIGMWAELRADNWHIAYKELKEKFNILKPTIDSYWCDPFSIIILCDSVDERTELKSYLIGERVYPAILWRMPDDSVFKDALDISRRILSVHCDPRYSKNDMIEICNRIKSFRQ
jgi:dTDP-4-amino-4,6-dideoxygalactose transaminase